MTGCLCSGPATGVCNGTWGGVTISDAGVDAESRVVIERSGVCGVSDLNKYDISWQVDAVQLALSYRTGGPSILASQTYDLLAPTGLETFSLTPTTPTLAGTLELAIEGVQGRRTGTLKAVSGTDSLECTFNVAYDTIGPRASCGSGGSDFD